MTTPNARSTAVRRHTLTLPDLGLADRSISSCVWLVAEGSEVSEGDRMLEVLSDSVTVDLPAPVSGIVTQLLVGEDELISVGQALAVIEEFIPVGDES